MSDYNLKPCPFCGGKAKKWRWNGGVGIQCENYNPDNHQIQMMMKTEIECVEKWNTRAVIENE